MSVDISAMKASCITCSKWSPRRASAEMARIGFGACDHQDPFVAFFGEKDRDCQRFVGAKPEDVAARREWLQSKKDGVQQVMEGRT